jgi:hypothetical protein
MTTLPPELWMEIAQYTTLPYSILLTLDEKWGHLRTLFQDAEDDPEPIQIQVLWTYWNFYHFKSYYVIPAIEGGLRYIPLLSRILYSISDAQDFRIVHAILRTLDFDLFHEVVEPVLVEYGGSLPEDEGVSELLATALLVKHYPAVRCIMDTIKEYDPEDEYTYQVFVFTSAFSSFIAQCRTPITSPELEILLDLLEFQPPESFIDSPETSARPAVIPVLWGTPHTELLSRILARITIGEFLDTLAYRRYIIEEQLGFYKDVLEIAGSSIQLTPEFRKNQLLSLYENGDTVTDTFYRGFFDLFYSSEVDLMPDLASERSLVLPPYQNDRDITGHVRMLQELIRRRGRDVVVHEFTMVLNENWDGTCLVRILQELS